MISFVMPVHGRDDLARVCLRQLRRTCDQLGATAVVVGQGDTLDYAYDLGFSTVPRDNTQLGRRFNDGFQLACDPDYNPNPADYVVPCGSDDWIDPNVLTRMPPPNTIGIFQQLAVVSEDRTRLAKLTIGWKGGAGVRVIPSSLIARAGYRPCEEDRRRACDTSTLEGIKRASRGRFPDMVSLDRHPLQIVDFKSGSEQLNSYRSMVGGRRRTETENVWDELAAVFPEAVADLRETGA